MTNIILFLVINIGNIHEIQFKFKVKNNIILLNYIIIYITINYVNKKY